MNSSRRRFFSRIAGGVAGTLIAPLIGRAEPHHRPSLNLQSIRPDDEKYWSEVRDQFPLTHDRVHFNAGTIGPSPYPVIEAVKRTIDDLETRGEYDGWEVARPKVARLVNVDPTEISLTHNTTEGINIIAHGLPLKRGDEVIITTHEHAGNALPWLNRAKLDGIVLKTFTPAQSADETLNRIERLIGKRTRVIAVPHITCTVGHVLPVREISRLGHDKNVWVFFDGAHGPGSTRLDLKEIGCDFYAACGHKWMCGPNGTGFLYIKKGLLDIVQARHIGAYSDLGWNLASDSIELKGYVPTAHRYDYGTQSAALYTGLAAAVEFIETIGDEIIEQQTRSLATHLQQELLNLGDRIEMLTPTEERSRGPMIGFRLKNVEYRTFGEHAAQRGFRIRLVPESHLDAIRVSTHLYNSVNEVDRFVEAVKEIG